MSQIPNNDCFVIFKEGDILPAHEIRATKLGLEIKTESLTTTVDPLCIEAIHPIEDLSKVVNQRDQNPNINENHTLMRTLCGIIEIERLSREFAEQSNARNKPFKIVIYGSASLALTILPLRVSHDVDVSAPAAFVTFCEYKMRKSHGAIPEFNTPAILRYLGNWEERSSQLEGLYGTEFSILHPLDTMMQKLLRIDKKRFEANDKKDISDILSKLNPSKETLDFLLTENPGRYRFPEGSAQAEALKRNTQWFLKKYRPGMQLSEISEIANKQEETNLIKVGLAPNSFPKTSLKKSVKEPINFQEEP